MGVAIALSLWTKEMLSGKFETVSTEYRGIFLKNRFATVDEIGIHTYQPERKEQSKERGNERGVCPPKENRTFSWKVYDYILLECSLYNLLRLFGKGQNHYRTVLCFFVGSFLNNEIRVKRYYLTQKKIAFHRDSAPTHTSAVVKAKLYDLCYQVLKQRPPSPFSQFGFIELLPVPKHDKNG
ncbi:hypothetical protein AVEN_266520-1 [Araneus ventricosus]|uniref:Mariner Mos1 transposase n=1 Tax=Araneus ventricosus TaxID=182803 RepID=A0A4Y2KY47_ARAVE|nr:hypothetical protein AVEN_266520-1 [Araneus ventricosus]